MKIIIAPDSFKGCLRSPEVCEVLKDAVLSLKPDCEVVCLPMADGGEGTTEAVVLATNGSFETVNATGPLGENVEAQFGLVGGETKNAVMEMATASGIELVPADKLNPMEATTYGTGEVLKAILDHGSREIIIGIGGSATVDGGAGMAQALGYRLLDADGKDIPRGGKGLALLKRIDKSQADPRLADARIRIACDVTNPLLGENGAAHVFGPQKGATPQMVEELEAGLANFAAVLKSSGLIENAETPGDGAAGGLGCGLRAFCGARIESGARMIIEMNGMKDHLEGARCVITGEGRTDSQTSSGKLCAVIAETAKKAGVPVILVAGALSGAPEQFSAFFDASFSIATGPCTLDEALANTKENLRLMGRNIAALL